MTTPYILFSKKHCSFMRPCIAENYGFVRYELPFINALAIEVPEEKLEAIRRHPLALGIARDASVSKLPCKRTYGHNDVQSSSGRKVSKRAAPEHDCSRRVVSKRAISDELHQRVEVMRSLYESQKSVNISSANNPSRESMKGASSQTMRMLSLMENKGFGTTIAVIDTGVAPHYDLVKPYNRIVAFKDFVNHRLEPYDDDGHGTHVAGIAAGNGYCSRPCYAVPEGRKHLEVSEAQANTSQASTETFTSPNCDTCCIGTAPMANIAALKALDENGSGATSDILAAMQWVADNKDKYNIRVLNLSLGVSVHEENPLDPLVIATTALTMMGILVVSAAGNSGPGRCTITSPGISPAVLTVGSCDGDRIPDFSSRGPTLSGRHKPDLVAPGVNIVSLDAKTGKTYTSHSGTSMSCPYAAGIAACLFSAHPGLTPGAAKALIFKMLTPLRGLHRDIQGRGSLRI